MIVHHEDWQPGIQIKDGGHVHSSYRIMHQRLAVERLGYGPPGTIQGEILASINHGRWIVDCPQQGCGGAVIASMEEPVYFCSHCGNAANDGHSYAVVFPKFWRELETDLVKRPAPSPMMAPHRNWKPGETLAAIKRETIAHRVEAA